LQKTASEENFIRHEIEEENEMLSNIPKVLWEHLKDHDPRELSKTGFILRIEHSANGRILKTPVEVKVEPGISKADIDLLNYIYTSLSRRHPSLIPWTWKNESIKKLMLYLRVYKTSSTESPQVATYMIYRFAEFAGMEPDEIVKMAEGTDGAKKLKKLMEDFVAYYRGTGWSPGYTRVALSWIETWLKCNEIYVVKVARPKLYSVSPDRAPTSEELEKMIELADLKTKAIIAFLATSGVRVGTLAKLKYKHIKHDFEKGTVPCAVYVPAEITKGKYADYYTFINEETVNYLKAYFKQRKQGTRWVPPETFTDETPIIRNSKRRNVCEETRTGLEYAVDNIIKKAGIKDSGGYTLKVHSLRKYFKTQLTSAGIPFEYVEFMMGHKTSTYLDVKMKGVDFLRNLYKASGISIKPKTRYSKVDMLKEIVRSLGLDPEKVLVKEALEPHRTIIGEEDEITALRKTLKEAIKEILGEKT
jgi:integrase